MKIHKQSYASLWQRILAFGLDYMIIAVYLALLVFAGTSINAARLDRRLLGNPVTGQSVGFLTVTMPVTLYFGLMESSAWQATWGKRIRRLKVVDGNNSRLSRGRAFGRTALKFVPWELAHGYIWQASFSPQGPSPTVAIGFTVVWLLIGANAISTWLSPGRQALYDRLAGTFVVSERAGNFQKGER